MRARYAKPKDDYRVLIKAFLVAAAVLLVADAAVENAWPNTLADSAARPRLRGNADREASEDRCWAVYYWRGALMRPSAADVGTTECPRQRPARHGMIVVKVVPGSPAARARLQPGDIVVGFDGLPVTTPGSLELAIADHGGGPRVRLRVWRQSPDGAVAVSLVVPAERGAVSEGSSAARSGDPRAPDRWARSPSG